MTRRLTFLLRSASWNAERGWATPKIGPYAPLVLDPSSTVFHYAFCLFEGMKAYRCEDGTVRLFRPDMNMARMNRSAARIALPVSASSSPSSRTHTDFILVSYSNSTAMPSQSSSRSS